MKGESNRYYVYILASQRNGTLYIGVTNDLRRRIFEHKNKIIKGFTAKYNIDKLVYWEVYANPGQAIYREKCLKEWPRIDKISLIEKDNPTWRDLYDDLF
jgi:putative endonuclease